MHHIYKALLTSLMTLLHAAAAAAAAGDDDDDVGVDGDTLMMLPLHCRAPASPADTYK